MAKFTLDIVTEANSRNVFSWTLGTKAAPFADADLNKAVVQNATGQMALAADGDEIQGFVEALETATVDGYSFGSITAHAPGVRQWVTGSGLAIGDLVVSGAQTAASVANAKLNHPKNSRGTTVVKKGTPANFKWIVRAVSTADTTLVLIEAI